MEELTEQEILELKESFSLFDKDGSGQIDESELKAVMNDCLGLKMTDDELHDLMNEIDTNQNGQIDFDEFCTLMAKNWSGTLDSEEEILDAFRAFDTDGSGSISVDEFRLFFSKLSWNLTNEEIEEMIADIDSNHDGEIDYREFAQMLFKGEYSSMYAVKRSEMSHRSNSMASRATFKDKDSIGKETQRSSEQEKEDNKEIKKDISSFEIDQESFHGNEENVNV